ncbi:MAG: PAS domain S-box protein [Bacteroidia bacterium]
MNRANELIKEQLKLDLKYLSGYAVFLIENKLEEFAHSMLKVCREENLPLWKHFESVPEERVIRIAIESSNELLGYFARNAAEEYIAITRKRWVENQLPYLLQKAHVKVEDITLLSFIRRKLFREFLPSYTSDTGLWFEIMDELDRFTTAQEESSIYTLLENDRNKLNEHLLFFEKITKTVPGIIYVFDLVKFQPEYVSTNREKLLGFEGDGKTDQSMDFWLTRIHPEDHDLVLDYFKNMETARDAEVRSLEYRLKNSEGNYQWFRKYDSVSKRNEYGKPVQVIGISIEVSKEKDTIQELKNRELQFQEAQEIARLGTFEWDLQGNDSSFSPQMMEIFDLEKAGNIGEFMEHVHPADQENLKRALSTAMQGDGRYECQYRYKRNQAKVIWSRGLVSFKDGKPYRMKGFVMDVTKNYLLSEMLAQSETTFHTLIQNAPDAVVVVDNLNSIVFWNPKAESIFGWKAGEVIGKTLFDSILRENSAPGTRSGVQWLKAQGLANTNKTIELVTQNKKGKEQVVAVSIATSLWNGKQAYIAFVRNITREKKIEKELEQNRNQLTQKNAELEKINTELTSFNYIASHDLKEPLRKIKTYSNFIIEKSNNTLSGDVQEYLKRIVTATSNMQKLIDDLLAFSRTSSMEKNLSLTDLNVLLEEVKASLRYTIEEHNVTISASALPAVKVIPFQFQQLLENIIGNAIKYRKLDISPEISITYDVVMGKNYVSDGALPDMEYNRISVKDNGIGFDQIYSRKIFEIFQRLHGKNEYAGTGIGLAICKKIVENHKGIITAEGVEGQGAIFHIFIPTRCPESTN